MNPSPRSDLGPHQQALVDALRALLAGAARGELGEAVRRQLGQDPVARPEQRISELVTGKRFPSADELDAIVRLRSCGNRAQQDRFAHLHAAAAAERESRRTGAGPPTPLPPPARAEVAGSRVGDPRNWVRLGVHAPITQLSTGEDLSDRVRAGELPGYVLREVDRLELRPALQAAERGEDPPVRLVVIVGESSAGKTRMAAEAARAVLPRWTLLVPRSAADLSGLQGGEVPLRRVLVWLDEVQDLLGKQGVVEALQDLLDLPAGPVVLLATLRADAEHALHGTPGWRLLDRADHRIPLHRRPLAAGELRAELDRARELVAEQGDPWLREALTKIGDRYGLAEWLAAGPQLLRHLDVARTRDNDPVARVGAALVDAAIDCYRAGYTAPIPEPLLAAAHRLYLPRYSGPGCGVEAGDPALLAAALDWVRRSVAGATGLLVHHPGRGDVAFDYLVDHRSSRPGSGAVPSGLWPILSSHLTPATLRSVTLGAHRHGQTGLAHHLADRHLALEPRDLDLLSAIGHLGGLERRAVAGDGNAARWLNQLLAERGDQAELKRRADAGDRHAAAQLAWLAERGDLTPLDRHTHADALHAAKLLAALMAERGDQTKLERRANAGDGEAARRLAALMTSRGDQAGLERRADAGDPYAMQQLARVLAEHGDEAELERRADIGDWEAGWRWAALVAGWADQAGLERRADAGDEHAAERLARLLAARDDLAGLGRRADAGDQHAASRRADILAKRGDEVELECLARGGDQYAAGLLVRLLFERDDLAGLERLANAGVEHAAHVRVGLLIRLGDQAGLECRADAGDQHADRGLVTLMAERGDRAALQRRADAGDQFAAVRLADLLTARGDLAGLERLAETDNRSAAIQLVRLLAAEGDEAGLERRANAGDQHAVAELRRTRQIPKEPM